MMRALPLIIVILLTACVGTPENRPLPSRVTELERGLSAPPHVPATAPATTTTAERRVIVDQALAMVGTPYRYGGTSPESGFDCSGLVQYSYAASGITVPRTSLEQFRYAQKIALRDALAGDIVFFQDQEKLSHVGIYLGDSQFVHAPASGRHVSIASLNTPYYQEHLIAVGRLLR